MTFFIDRPIGIDLGTTHSEVAVLDPSERDLHVYADRFGRKTMPSAVAWDAASASFLVGRAARAKRGSATAPVESIKRRMGQDTSVTVGPHTLRPDEVSAHILRALRDQMHEYLRAGAPADVDVRVSRAVITVPAYFDAPQLEATRNAGTLAGLDVLGLLQEPTAAAMYHTWRSALGDGNFLVYDLGGGTFDVSVLRCLGGEYQVLAIDGDNFLGGDDFDRRFAERLRQKLAATGYDLDLDVQGDAEDRARFGRLVHVAQEIKESLSTTEVLSVSKEAVLVDKSGEPVSLVLEVSRAEYEEAIADLVEATLACCTRALAQSHETAGVGGSDIDHVVLVGGSTRVPLVQRRVAETLVRGSRADVALQEEVDTCVALGAAVHAAQLMGLRLGRLADTDATATGSRSDGADDAGRGDGDSRGQVSTTRAPAVQLSVRSPLVTSRDVLRMRVDVEHGPSDAQRLEARSAGATVGSVEVPGVPADGLRLDVPLPAGEQREVALELRLVSPDGHLAVPLTVYRGDVRPRASALSKPSVVAKDISLEVVRAGRRERKVLLARGSGLPASAEHRFFTADQSGAVVLRVLQNRLPIKTLVVDVPGDLPLGTPVELTISCDDAMRIEARALVAGQELWAQIEPARLEPPRGAEAYEALLAEAEAAAKSLWGHEAKRFAAEHEMLAAGLREVIQVDPDKARALAVRLTALIEEYRGRGSDALSPPMARFEEALDGLRRIVYRSTGPMLGVDKEGWEARIGDLAERGDRAWEALDEVAWRRCYNEAQALRETIVQQEFAAEDINSPSYLARRSLTLRFVAQRLHQDLSDFVPSSEADVRTRQVAERDRLLRIAAQTLQRLEGLDTDDAKSGRSQLDQLAGELDRAYAAAERLPQLGLVTERGA
ncbi:MAG: Hsp70 family protein [Myxococcales bacterium]|nr:Hsp70 family protein [Myxococcales bacterium]